MQKMLVSMLFLRFAYVYVVLKFNIITSFGGIFVVKRHLMLQKMEIQLHFFTTYWNICDTVF